jgi:hypothetical protein
MLRVNGDRASVPENVNVIISKIVEKIRSLNVLVAKIYNWDETSLFYRSMPAYMLARTMILGLGQSRINHE